MAVSEERAQLRPGLPSRGSYNESPVSQLGTRLPAQDYEELRRKCVANNTLFEDPYFPADDTSLSFSEKLPFTPEWKRPGELCQHPRFIVGGASRFDVNQGLGNSWLVAAIASLTQDKRMLRQVVSVLENFDDRGYCGMFLFHFWHFGQWVDIVIDDRLPTRNNKLIFIHSTDANEFWSALLEKAYAKLYGGYESLNGGRFSEAMEDFTGGVTETFDLTQGNEGLSLFDRIKKSASLSSLISCSIKATTPKDVEAVLSSGLVKGHPYSVTGADSVQVKGKVVQLLRLRNPWGRKEWNGDWSDDSPSWKQISSARRKELLEGGDAGKEDGEFWMSWADVKKHFTDLEITNVSIDPLHEDEAVKNWDSIIKKGSWEVSRGTAGGCRNFPTFVKNPQFIIDLQEDDDGDGKCSCLISLMQKNRRKQKKMGVQDLCIGFSVYKAPDDGSNVLTKRYVDRNLSAGNSGSFTNAREVQKRFDLDPGCYIVIPCSFKPDEEGDFLLRIFTEAKRSTTEAGVPTEGQAPVNPKVQAMFSRLAGADNEIDSEELQDMLTLHFSQDNMRSAVFSLDACRSMIAMLDEDKNGTLNFEEFQTLLVTIGTWKRLFNKYDRDRSGTLEKSEVASAIWAQGYNLSPDSTNILFNRFAKRRKYMNMDDFVACFSRVKIMNDNFKKLSHGGSLELTEDQFYKITLDA